MLMTSTSPSTTSTAQTVRGIALLYDPFTGIDEDVTGTATQTAEP